MSRYVSQAHRNVIASNAYFICEYCLIHQDDSYFSHQIDHIISLKHGGDSNLNNLAYSCITCNRNKGSDIGSILVNPEVFVRLYHPRRDRWIDHFQLNNTWIEGLTDIGTATIQVLAFNHIDRVLERQLLKESGRYLPTGAESLIL